MALLHCECLAPSTARKWNETHNRRVKYIQDCQVNPYQHAARDLLQQPGRRLVVAEAALDVQQHVGDVGLQAARVPHQPLQLAVHQPLLGIELSHQGVEVVLGAAQGAASVVLRLAMQPVVELM